MNPRQVIDQIDAGRRAASRLLTMMDVGLDPVEVIREAAPSLSEPAVQAAAQLAQLALFDLAGLSLVLSGLIPDSRIDGLEIPAAPPRPQRPSPQDLADAWLLGAPPAPEPRRP